MYYSSSPQSKADCSYSSQQVLPNEGKEMLPSSNNSYQSNNNLHHVDSETFQRPDGPSGENKEYVSLIVNYLPANMTEEDIKSLFSCVGRLHSCKLMMDIKNGGSKGYAFVNYFDAKGAMTAIRTYNGLKLQNKVIRVAFSRPGGEEIKGANIYVAGLPNTLTGQGFRTMFSRFGNVVTSTLLTEGKYVGEGRGAGMVRYDLRAQAEMAVKEMHGKVPEGGRFPLVVRFARPPGEKKVEEMAQYKAPSLALASRINNRFSPVTDMALLPPVSVDGTYILYVSNLPPDTQESLLWKLFAPFGAVLKVTPLIDATTGQGKGVAFVNMKNGAEALAAIHSLNGCLLDDRSIRVAFKTPKRTTRI